MDTDKLMAGVQAAARKAGELMLSADHIRESVRAKSGHANFVTDYDRQVQALLFSELSLLLPEAVFIGEEDGADLFTPQAREGWAWCVDPIDGTSNFLTGYRPSVTSIALLRQARPFLGVVYNPYEDLMFSAVDGQGARCGGRPILSSPEPLERSLAVFGTAPYNPELTERTFDLCRYYLPRCIDLRRSGTAAWDLCSVARGALGLYFEVRLSLWDYAAGGLIAREAGCVLTTLEGGPIGWDGPSSMLCASRGAAAGDYLPPDRRA